MGSSPSTSRSCLRDGKSPCRDSHRCFDCWYDAGETAKETAMIAKVDESKWPESIQLFVEDGISMLAQLLSEKESKQSGEDVQARTVGFDGNSHRIPEPFRNGIFTLRSGRHTPPDEPCFTIRDFEVRWDGHVGRTGRQNRKVKGREWARMMQEALASL